MHHCPSPHPYTLVRVSRQRPRASPQYVAAGATGTTPPKQTSLPALYKSSRMLSLCPFLSLHPALQAPQQVSLEGAFLIHCLLFSMPVSLFAFLADFVGDCFLMYPANQHPLILCGAIKAWLRKCV